MGAGFVKHRRSVMGGRDDLEVGRRSAVAMSAREAVVREVARVAGQFPDVGLPELALGGLGPVDARLATAMHRLVLQRWRTLAFLLDRFLERQSLARLEPVLQGVLLTGAAQLVFMDRLPTYAVVDEMVSIARRRVRPGAGGLVNAVLRRLGELVEHADLPPGWELRADRLPNAEGGQLALAEPVLPSPEEDWLQHVSVACSLPVALLTRWQLRWGRGRALALARHATLHPPTLVTLEAGAEVGEQAGLEPHIVPGVGVWGGEGDLKSLLAGHPDRRVQDPTAAAAVQASAKEPAGRILDFCAGLGTKTRQLLSAFPQARVVACDVSEARHRVLASQAAGVDRLSVVSVAEALAAGPFDLLVLDVPCSNLGVLARRPGARYRYNARSMEALVALQREIMCQAVPQVVPGGRVLYSTCSIDEAENQRQAAYLVRHLGCELLEDRLTLPDGMGATYHDGGYFAVLRVVAGVG